MKSFLTCLCLALSILAVSFTLNSAQAKSRTNSNTGGGQNQTGKIHATTPAVTSNKMLTPDGDAWTLAMTNTTGLSQRCAIYGDLMYTAKNKDYPARNCLLQAVILKGDVVNSKARIKTKDELARTCAVPAPKAGLKYIKVTTVSCEQVANEEGSDDAVVTEPVENDEVHPDSE